jgi:hypothetical protein
VANTLLTMQMITNDALANFENELGFVRYINRQYDDSFAKTGAKIGDTLNIRKPVRFNTTTGQAISIQDVTETSVPLTLTTQANVAFTFSSADLALKIDDFRERYIRPAVIALANKVDYDMLTMATNATFNSVGTPGTPIANGTLLAQAGAKLDMNAAPKAVSVRAAVWDPISQANLITGTQSLFNPADTISGQYKTGNMGIAYGFRNSMDQNVQNRVVGPLGGTPLVNGAGQTGASLITDGWTAAAAARLNKGDVFTIANVFSVNPISYQSTGQLKQFTATANVSSDGSGNATVPITPAIVTTGVFKNVDVSSIADNAPLTIVGAAATLTTQNLAYHRDAFTLACADLPLPGNADMAARANDKQTGLSIRLVRQYDVMTDLWPTRMDILYGGAPLYPEWSCRIQA